MGFLDKVIVSMITPILSDLLRASVDCIFMTLLLALPIVPFLQFLILDHLSHLSPISDDLFRSANRIRTDLDPVSVRIQNKGHRLHSSVRQSFLPLHTFLFKSRASGVQIINTDADVTKTLGLGVSVVVREVSLLLCAVVPSQPQEPFMEGNAACGRRRGAAGRITQVVEVKSS